MNCCVAPTAKLAVAGVTAIEVRVGAGAVTVSVVFAEIEPSVPVMVVFPAATVVATPEALIVATEVLDEAQVVCAVTSAVVPSL